MKELSFNGLFLVTLVAVAAPILIATVRWLKVPAIALEILAGIVIGPSVLGWVKVDAPIEILSLIGLTYLLFLAGLEIDLVGLKGRLLRLALAGFVLSLSIGIGEGVGFSALGWVRSPVFLGIVLAATSLGLVVSILEDADRADTRLGELTIGAATIAEFGTVILISVFFSQSAGSATRKLLALASYVVIVAAVGASLLWARRSARLDRVITQLQDTTAEIRVRMAVALLIGLAALAAIAGLEIILGAFIAGVILNLVNRGAMNQPNFRIKLDSIGYGFLIPVFFVTSGLRVDLRALAVNRSVVLEVPLFLLALLTARGLPAFLYRSTLGWRDLVAAGFLQATSLTFIVAATSIGLAIGAVSPATASGLVSAGLLSVLLFPLIALSLASRPRPVPPLSARIVASPTTADHPR